MIKLSLIVKSLLIILLFQELILAQDFSIVKINIFDQNSNQIPNSTIHIRDLNGKLIKEVVNSTPEVLFNLPLKNTFTLEIFSKGFKPYNKQIVLNDKTNTIDVILEIDVIKAEVKINKEVIDTALEDSLNKTWTAEEIEALPFNPQDLESEIKRKYGDDVIIRVNGFTGGQLPPKEQISSIKVIKSSVDAEFHTLGKTVVDVRTKAGLSSFFGVVAFNFNDSKLNARNPFAASRLPEQNKSFISYLTGPIVQKKASFNLLFLANNAFETKNIVAFVPNKEIDRKTKAFTKIILSSVGIDYNLNTNHTLNFSYYFEKIDNINFGVGELNLAETSFNSNDRIHQIRIFESGIINKQFVNEFRIELTSENLKIVPKNFSPSITVLGNFISGGALINNQLTSKKLNLTDNIFFDKTNHFIKLGTDFQFERKKVISKDGLNGSFVFTSLNDFQNNIPSVFTQRQRESLSIINQSQVAFYIQDDIRLYKNFQIGLGLRYEIQNNLSDYNNFSPRLSFVYSPNKEGRFIFRGGTGIFYQWLESATLSNILNTIGQASDLIVIGQNNKLPPSVKTIDDSLTNPIIFVLQTGVNFRVNKKLNVETLYKFQRGNHLFRSRDVNAPYNGIRPNPLFGKISQLESSGISSENSLEIITEGSFIKGANFNLRYKLAKEINNFDGIFDLPMDNYNVNNEKAVSSLDRRHKITGSLNYLLFKKLQVTPIFKLYSSLPYTIITGRDENGDTVFNDRPSNIKRNSERGEWLKQIDLQLSWRMSLKSNNKSTSADEPISKEEIIKALKKSIGINVTMQNLLNSTNPQNYIGNQLSPFYRKATSSTTARRIQIGINFIF